MKAARRMYAFVNGIEVELSTVYVEFESNTAIEIAMTSDDKLQLLAFDDTTDHEPRLRGITFSASLNGNYNIAPDHLLKPE